MTQTIQNWTLAILIALCLLLALMIHNGLSEKGHNLRQDATTPLRWSNQLQS